MELWSVVHVQSNDSPRAAQTSVYSVFLGGSHPPGTRRVSHKSYTNGRRLPHCVFLPSISFHYVPPECLQILHGDQTTTVCSALLHGYVEPAAVPLLLPRDTRAPAIPSTPSVLLTTLLRFDLPDVLIEFTPT